MSRGPRRFWASWLSHIAGRSARRPHGCRYCATILIRGRQWRRPRSGLTRRAGVITRDYRFGWTLRVRRRLLVEGAVTPLPRSAPLLFPEVDEVFRDNRISGIPENLQKPCRGRLPAFRSVGGQRIPYPHRDQIFEPALWPACFFNAFQVLSNRQPRLGVFKPGITRTSGTLIIRIFGYAFVHLSGLRDNRISERPEFCCELCIVEIRQRR